MNNSLLYLPKSLINFSKSLWSYFFIYSFVKNEKNYSYIKDADAGAGAGAGAACPALPPLIKAKTIVV